MKLAALCLIVLGLAIGTAVSCSVNHRSGDFACTTKANCAAGRDCIDGFCALPQLDAGLPDTAPGVDAALCPPQCSSCNLAQHTCTISCGADPAACNERVICPAGWGCNVNCTTDDSCRRGVDCAGSSSCNITCSGDQSCRNIACSTGTCDVTCSGEDSCDGVSCGAGTCTVGCSGPGSCPAVDCGLGTCTVGCTNVNSCANVTCGLGACNVGCVGNNSCQEVDCGLSCACEVDCRFNSSCLDVTCRPTCDNKDPFDGCVNTPAPNCNMCQ